jgi:hypothetical protein
MRMNPLSRDLAERIREVLADLDGEHGAQSLADDLGLPLRMWANDERDVAVSGLAALKVIELIGTKPRWLLTEKRREYLERGSKGRGLDGRATMRRPDPSAAEAPSGVEASHGDADPSERGRRSFDVEWNT